jgi:hypothetical protein
MTAYKREAVEKMARVGYAARAIVYAIVGTLALMVAIGGSGGKLTDAKGALAWVAEQAYGPLMLSLLATALVCFVGWRWVQAFLNPERVEQNNKGTLKRITYFVSGAIYGSIAVAALKSLATRGAGPRAGSAPTMTAKLMAQPMGQLLVAAVGVTLIVFAVIQLRSAWKQSFAKKLKLFQLDEKPRRLALNVSRVGIAARALVFSMMGAFLIKSAIDANPREAKGMSEALQSLAQQPFGTALLALAAVGLLAFAAYQIVEALYRRIEV